MGVGDGDREPRHLEDRQVGGVIAYARNALRAQAQNVEQFM
jgi:hypothetical protein